MDVSERTRELMRELVVLVAAYQEITGLNLVICPACKGLSRPLEAGIPYPDCDRCNHDGVVIQE